MAIADAYGTRWAELFRNNLGPFAASKGYLTVLPKYEKSKMYGAIRPPATQTRADSPNDDYTTPAI